MQTEKKRPAQSKNELVAFQFNATSQEVQTILHDNDPWIVAKDVCDILGLSNPTRALSSLDDDEKLTLPIVRAGQTRETNLVNESGLYSLIFKSRKKEAKAFRKWVTSEVLPTIRKKGYYHTGTTQGEFIDARDVPYQLVDTSGYKVRCIVLQQENWFSINDINRAIGSHTESSQTAKKLNAKQELAKKIFLYGNTQPAWFTNELGASLIISGSRVIKSNQLNLPL